MTTTKARTTRATVEPNGQFCAFRYWSRASVPSVAVLPPPSSSGITKLPRLGMNTNSEPVIAPWAVSGKIIVRKRVKAPAPRLVAASVS